MGRTVTVSGVRFGQGHPLALIAGPCVIPDRKTCLDVARGVAELRDVEHAPVIFKASYDKANRSSGTSFRGPGLQAGLEILAEVKARYGLPVLTDVHSVEEVEPAAEVADVLQIPAFLCRQTDLVLAAGRTGKPVNVKKGQFMAPWDMGNVVKKLESTGNRQVLVTERGVCFGYNNLVADMRSLPLLRGLGYPVVFDATHSVQRPGGAGTRSGGDAKWAPLLARAAVAAGCDVVFVETYRSLKKAPCDRDNAIVLRRLGGLWRVLRALDEVVRGKD